MIKTYTSRKTTEKIWDIPLDTEDPNHPIITISIRCWDPFKYTVCLRAMIAQENKEIIRWDNVNRPDHVDVFFLNGPPRKHQRSSLGRMQRLSDLGRIFDHIGKHYKRYINDYKR